MKIAMRRSIDLTPVENEDGSITVTLSTATPCREELVDVVWNHEAVNLERAPYGIGLYAEHNYAAETVGIIDNVRVDPTRTKLLGDIRFRSNQRSQDYRLDVLNGTVRGISAGINKGKATYRRLPGAGGAADTIILSNWEPIEASLTNMPTDIRSGFGAQRTLGPDDAGVELDSLEEEPMATEPTPSETPVVPAEGDTPEVRAEVPAVETPAVEAVEASLEEQISTLTAQLAALESQRAKPVDLIPTAAPVVAPVQEVTGEKRTMTKIDKDAPLSTVVRTDADSRYNFGTALRCMAQRTALTGPEAEYQQESERVHGKPFAGGLYLNVPALATRTMTTNGVNASTSMAAGILPVAGGNFGLLFPESIFGKLGVATRQASGPVQVVYGVGAPTVAGIGENPAAGTAATDMTYQERTVKMITATAKVIVSQDALSDTNLINLEQDINLALKEQVRVSVEAAAFGYPAAPTAVQNQFGIFQAGTKLAWAAAPAAGDLALTTVKGVQKLDELTSTIEDANAGISDVQYFVKPADYNKLKYIPWQGSNGAKMLLQDGMLAENAPVQKVSKNIMGLAPTLAGDNDTTCTSTIAAVKKNALTLFELSAPIIKIVEDENLVSKGLVCFHISYRYAVVLNRPEFATFLNVKL